MTNYDRALLWLILSVAGAAAHHTPIAITGCIGAALFTISALIDTAQAARAPKDDIAAAHQPPNTPPRNPTKPERRL